VQPDPLARQQVVVDRLGEQRVAERVALGAHRDQHVAFDGRAKRPIQSAGVDVHHVREQLVRDPATSDRGGPDDDPGGVLELVEPDEEQIRQVGRQRRGAELGGGDQLLGEERVAFGARHDGLQGALRHRGGVQGANEGPDVGVGEGLQLEPGHGGQAGPLGDGLAQRMPAVQVVTAVRRDDRDSTVERPGEQEAQHLPRRLVGPVEVFDDEEQGLGDRELVERSMDGVEEVGPLDPLGFGVIAVGEEAPARHQAGDGGAGGDECLGEGGRVRREATEGFAEGEVREGAVAEVEAVSEDRTPPGRAGLVA
jgi:hypothetical protein